MAWTSRSEATVGGWSVTMTAVMMSPGRSSFRYASFPLRRTLTFRAAASLFENTRFPSGPRTMMLSPETARTLPVLIVVTYTGVVVVVVVIVAVTCIPGFRSATPMSRPSNWNLNPSGIVYSVA
jgi:hypothetical protein